VRGEHLERASALRVDGQGYVNAIWSPSKSALKASQTRGVLDRLTFDENRLERLNPQTVERRARLRSTTRSWMTSSSASQISSRVSR